MPRKGYLVIVLSMFCLQAGKGLFTFRIADPLPHLLQLASARVEDTGGSDLREIAELLVAKVLL